MESARPPWGMEQQERVPTVRGQRHLRSQLLQRQYPQKPACRYWNTDTDNTRLMQKLLQTSRRISVSQMVRIPEQLPTLERFTMKFRSSTIPRTPLVVVRDRVNTSP